MDYNCSFEANLNVRRSQSSVIRRRRQLTLTKNISSESPGQNFNNGLSQ